MFATLPLNLKSPNNGKEKETKTGEAGRVV
jgi:hypothetical protein